MKVQKLICRCLKLIYQRRLILLIVILAVLVRLVYVLLFPQVPLLMDPVGYDKAGWRLVQGMGLPLVKIDNESIVPRPPGYPMFLASIYLVFGHNYQAVRIIQAILDSLTCLIIFYLGSRVFNVSIGYISSICYAFYYPVIIYTGLLYTESLFTLILAISMLFLFFAIENDRVKYWIGSGVFFGLATLVSSRSMYLPLFIFGGLFWKTLSVKKTLRRVGIIVLCMLVLFSPWTLRNYLTTRRFILLESYGQNMTALWLATNPYGAMDWNMTKEPLKSRFGNLTEEERVKIFQEEAWKNLKRYPLTYLKNSIKRFFVLWISSHSNRISGFEKSFYSSWKDKDWDVFLLKLFLLSINTIFVIFGFLGLWFSRDKWKQTCLAIILPIFYFSIIATFYVSGPRLQVPMVPYMMIFAVVGIANILNSIRNKLYNYKFQKIT